MSQSKSFHVALLNYCKKSKIFFGDTLKACCTNWLILLKHNCMVIDLGNVIQ